MGHQDDGPAAAGAPDVGQQMRLGTCVQRTGRLVQDQHARVADDGAGDRQELALAQREAGAALAEDGLVALGQPADELVGADEARGGHDPGERAVGRTHADVLGDGAGEQLHLLRHDADLRPVADRGEGGEVLAVEQHAAGLGQFQAEQEADQRALARARRAGDAQHGARRQLEGHAVERRCRGTRIAEGELLDLETALDRQLATGQPAAGLGALAQELVEPPDGLARLPELVPGQRQLAHGRQGARGQDRGGDQGADGQVAGHDQPGAEIDQDQCGQVLQCLAQAAGEVGDAAGLQPGPGAAQQVALEAPLHVGLERQQLDGQRLADGLAEGGGLGAGGAEAGTLVQRLLALGQHGDAGRRPASPPR